MTVLVDTGAWYALADRSDARHAEARRWYQSRALHEDLVTTDLILAETFTLLMSRLGHQAARAWWDAFRAASLRYVVPTPSDFDRASEVLAQFSDHHFSLTDCVSFAIMERLGVYTAFSFPGGKGRRDTPWRARSRRAVPRTFASPWFAWVRDTPGPSGAFPEAASVRPGAKCARGS